MITAWKHLNIWPGAWLLIHCISNNTILTLYYVKYFLFILKACVKGNGCWLQVNWIIKQLNCCNITSCYSSAEREMQISFQNSSWVFFFFKFLITTFSFYQDMPCCWFLQMCHWLASTHQLMRCLNAEVHDGNEQICHHFCLIFLEWRSFQSYIRDECYFVIYHFWQCVSRHIDTVHELVLWRWSEAARCYCMLTWWLGLLLKHVNI